MMYPMQDVPKIDLKRSSEDFQRSVDFWDSCMCNSQIVKLLTLTTRTLEHVLQHFQSSCTFGMQETSL